MNDFTHSFLGIEGDYSLRGLFEEKLEDYDGYYLTAGFNFNGKTDEEITKYWSMSYSGNHAYSVESYDAESQTITLLNPHDSREKTKISLELFKDIGSLQFTDASA